MKMFLTRLGDRAKALDQRGHHQIDLDPPSRSGLAVVEEILSTIDGISFIHLGGRDVVRHRIVQDIVEAYGRYTQPKLEVES